jgi:hypothetical protein
MRRKVLFYLINALIIITIFYFSNVISEIIVNDSRLIKTSLMGSFILWLTYCALLDQLGIYKS